MFNHKYISKIEIKSWKSLKNAKRISFLVRLGFFFQPRKLNIFQIYYLDPITLKSYQFCNLFHVVSLIYCKNWEKNKENRWNAKRVSFLARSGGFSQPIELGIVSIFISKVYLHKNLSHYKILEKKSFWPNSRIPLQMVLHGAHGRMIA